MKQLMIMLIKAYKKFLSPYLPNSCRFYPTCSSYSIDAFEKHGFFKGLWLTTYRILRCNPFNRGGVDNVPDKFYFLQKKDVSNK